MQKRLLEAYKTWYDVTENFTYEGETFAGFAEFHSFGEKYVLSKKAKLWEVSAHEYVFFDMVEGLTPLNAAMYIRYMTEKAIKMVKPDENHMSSDLSLIIIADKVDDDARKLIRKFRWRENHGFLGLKGWSDLRIAVVDLADASVTTNPAGKKLRASVEPNVRLAQES